MVATQNQQAFTKPGSADNLLIRLQLHQPTCGALGPLMSVLKQGGGARVSILGNGAGEEGNGGSDGEGREERAATAAAATPGAARARGEATLQREPSEEDGDAAEERGGRHTGRQPGSSVSPPK